MSRKYQRTGFTPYDNYLDSSERIESFYQMVRVSIGLTRHLLEKDKSSKRPSRPTYEAARPGPASYSMAFRRYEKSPPLVRAWLRYSEYGKHEGLSEEVVRELAGQGRLGPIRTHPSDGAEVIIWPPDCQAKIPNDFPEPGTYAFSEPPEVKRQLSVNIAKKGKGFSKGQGVLLSAAKSLGNPDDVVEVSSSMLAQTTLLQKWSTFEVFVKQVVQSIIYQHPEVLTRLKGAQETNLNLGEIVSLSDGLSSIEILRSNLIRSEISRIDSGGESASGLIKYLKEHLAFTRDPFGAEYLLNGKRHQTHINDLAELREVRNFIMHDTGASCEKLVASYPEVPNENGSLRISNDYYFKSELILDSIAYNIASQIMEKEYTVRKSRSSKTVEG